MNTRSNAPADVFARLSAFAERRGADGLRRAFHMMGISGKRGECHSCPVAEYLLAKTGADMVMAQHHNVDYLQRGEWHRMGTPGEMASFMVRFDFGHYPELVKGGAK